MVGFRDVQQFDELLGTGHFKTLSTHTHHKPNGNEKAKGKALVCCHGCFLANLEKQSVTMQNMHTKKKREKAKEKTSFKFKMKKEHSEHLSLFSFSCLFLFQVFSC